MSDAARDQLARVVRQHAGQLAVALMRVTGDFATAEDLVQDAGEVLGFDEQQHVLHPAPSLQS